MSDETPKVEPCAWSCGCEVRIYTDIYGNRFVRHKCHFQGDKMRVYNWNNRQQRILAARRKDFDAARLTDGRTTQYWKFDCFDEYLRGGE